MKGDGAKAISEGAGGGSGGSIWITAGNLSGGGFISANGGSGDYPQAGGGGGGRIALYYGAKDFNGVVSAFGGAGSVYGGAGTVFLRSHIESVLKLMIYK